MADHVLERQQQPAARRPRRTAAAARAPSRARSAPRRSPGRARARRGSARGPRCTGTAGPARRRAASAPGRSRARRAGRARPARRLVAVVDAADRGCPRRRAPGMSAFFQRRDCARSSRSTRSRIAASASRGVSPSCERTGSPDAAWSIRPATRTMKNSSRFEEKIAQNLTRSSSGSGLVRREREHALVEVEPRELAVEQRRVAKPRRSLSPLTTSLLNRRRRPG